MIYLQTIANDWAKGQLSAARAHCRQHPVPYPGCPTCPVADAAAQADSARRYLGVRGPTVSGLCDNCSDWGADLQRVPEERGLWCLRCREMCHDCGNHPPTEGHTQACIDRAEEAAIEAARCTFCGADDCRKHTNAELLARGGGNL